MKRSKRAAARPSREQTGRLRRRAAAIVLAGALVYANSLAGPFVFDDRGTILDNHTIERIWDREVLSAPQETPVAGRPVVNVSFAVNYALHGREVGGYHVGNIAIHLLSGLMVFAVVRRTLQFTSLKGTATNMAFAIALIWTLHPLNSEVVNYLSQRTESLMGFFFLLTMYAGIRAMQRPPGHGWVAAAILACALGMGSKESMVTAPVLMLIYDRSFVARSVAEALRTRWRLYVGLATTWIVLALLVVRAPRALSAGFSAHDADPWTYVLNQAVMVTRYLWLSIWPADLTLYYGWPRPLTLADVWLPALFVVSLLALTAIAWIRSPKVGFLGVWFFLTLAPTSSFVPIATEVGAERRMYLPLIAVIGAIYLAIERAGDRAIESTRSIARGTSFAICFLLAVATIGRNREYQSSLRLAETTFERWPSPGAHSMLGTELAASRRFDEAESHLRRAAPQFPPARYYLATVLAKNGHSEEAIAQFRQFTREQPSALDQVHLARGLMAELLVENGRLDEAVEQYRLMVAARPADSDARKLLAATLVRQKAYEEAIGQYQQLLSQTPTDVHALGGLGIALASVGRLDQAIVAFRRAVDLDPHNRHAQQNLARAMEMKR